MVMYPGRIRKNHQKANTSLSLGGHLRDDGCVYRDSIFLVCFLSISLDSF